MKNLSVIMISAFLFSCSTQAQKSKTDIKKDENKMIDNNIEYATFGGGCFWCTEAIFEQLNGVVKVESGFSGGYIKNPAYREVVSGRTGHAEVIHIVYEPAKIEFIELLEVFFNTHDPTTLNRQGADRGTQYRSVIFYHTENQKNTANQIINELGKEKVFLDKIVTEVTGFDAFYVADDYHQDYYENNKTQGYCQVVINPKLEKFQKQFKDKLKKK